MAGLAWTHSRSADCRLFKGVFRYSVPLVLERPPLLYYLQAEAPVTVLSSLKAYEPSVLMIDIEAALRSGAAKIESLGTPSQLSIQEQQLR